MIVFLDSFALIAWLNPRDQANPLVSQYFRDYKGNLLTTEWVLMEVADAFSNTHHKKRVIKLFDNLRNDSLVKIIGYKQSVYQNGFNLFSSRLDKDWSLTDCISFVVMTEHSVTDALTADHHFEQAGFRPIFK